MALGGSVSRTLFLVSCPLLTIFLLLSRLMSRRIRRMAAGIAMHYNDDRKDNTASIPSVQPPINIAAILHRAANTSACLQIYEPGNMITHTVISYRQLLKTARTNAARLLRLPGWKPASACVVCLDNHSDNIICFWSVVLAGGIPTLCSPSTHQDARQKMQHLHRLLSDPLCLTTESRLTSPELMCLKTFAIEPLEVGVVQSSGEDTFEHHAESYLDTATIMLTSGSSGNSKAVPLSHHQIFSCLNGKAHALPCDPGTSILNWVNMDHVAGLIEGHIRGLFEGVDQVHVESADIVSDPAIFIDLLWRHKVSSSFAPNFLLSKIVDGIESQQLKLSPSCNLESLRTIASGGEACVTDICHRFTSILQRYGAPTNVIIPGFGMTETCAGCIFNRSCPSTDLDKRYEFTSVGKCVPGVEMRIASLNDMDSTSQYESPDHAHGTVGDLQLRGDIVFRGYLNDAKANAASFTPDGWFRTGDLGFVDATGNLVLTGRSKETICINGVKYLPADQDRVIEEAQIPGVTPGFVVSFAWRPVDAPTEQCFVVYQHSYASDDRNARALAQREISKVILLSTGSRPQILPLQAGVLQKSTLGKLSRARIGLAVKQGRYAEAVALNTAMLETATSLAQPTCHAEEVMMSIAASQLQLKTGELGLDTSFFEAGITSIDLIRMRSQICQAFRLPSLSIKTLITHNTVRTLLRAITPVAVDREREPRSDEGLPAYRPVIQLRSTGSKTPLWLIHPGVGEVLVFVDLSQHIRDRPVYALRARGFEEGEPVFGSIDEAVTAYIDAIRMQQPRGPYALAGYSYGSMLAFEICKRLEALGDEIGFLGCLNLPPHIKHRMQQMSPQNCLLHLAQFLQLIDEKQTGVLEVQAANSSFELTMECLLLTMDQARWRDLDLSREGLARRASVAYSLQNLAVDYEPTGHVQSIDVFYCDPLAFAARSKEEWLNVQLSKWGDFSRSSPAYHSVEGAHYTMLSSAHVRSFQRSLERAMTARDI